MPHITVIMSENLLKSAAGALILVRFEINRKAESIRCVPLSNVGKKKKKYCVYSITIHPVPKDESTMSPFFASALH